MRERIVELNGAQLTISEARMKQNLTVKNVVQPKVSIKDILPDRSLQTAIVDINQAYYIYIGYAARLLNYTFTEIYDPLNPFLTEPQRALYFLKESGLETLRNMSERVCDFYINYYLNRRDIFSKFNLISMILGIVFIVVAILIVVPKIFSVNTTNMKVLSLFGYISPQEVQKLADQCEDFIYNYLDELALKEDSSYVESKLSIIIN